MMATLAAAVVALFLAPAAQAPSGGGQVYKSENATCQVTLPGNWKIGDFDASDPKGTLRVTVFHEQDAKVEKADEATLKIAYQADKVFENSGQRIFVESKTMAMGPIPAGRKWQVLVPAVPRGACQAFIVFREGGSDEIAREVALSLKPAK